MSTPEGAPKSHPTCLALAHLDERGSPDVEHQRQLRLKEDCPWTHLNAREVSSEVHRRGPSRERSLQLREGWQLEHFPHPSSSPRLHAYPYPADHIEQASSFDVLNTTPLRRT